MKHHTVAGTGVTRRCRIRCRAFRRSRRCASRGVPTESRPDKEPHRLETGGWDEGGMRPKTVLRSKLVNSMKLQRMSWMSSVRPSRAMRVWKPSFSPPRAMRFRCDVRVVRPRPSPLRGSCVMAVGAPWRGIHTESRFRAGSSCWDGLWLAHSSISRAAFQTFGHQHEYIYINICL